MAPKAAPTKAQKQQQEKIAIDKSFGMKNKNKSKAVQKYIKQITSNMTGQSIKADEDARKAKDDKQKQVQAAALMNSIFNMSTDKKGRAFDPIAKKKAKEAEEEAIAAGKKLKEDVRKAIIEGIANTIRLTNVKGVRMSEMGGHPIIASLKEKYADTFKIISLLLFIKANKEIFWVNDPEDNNPTIRCKEDVDSEEGPDERDLEEIIDERRKALGPGGTPVTELSFRAWKERKDLAIEMALQAEKDARQKAAKKAGAKDGTGLSGKDLFTFDASLFVDDEGAVGADLYDDRASHADSDEDEDAKPDDEEDDEKEDGHKFAPPARSSASASGATGSAQPVINQSLFLDGDDLPDDLDDLDDDDE